MKTDYYVIAGFDDKNKIGFLSYDLNSGGYPYISPVCRDLTQDITKAISWLNDAKKNLRQLKNPKVCNLSIEEVDISPYIDEINEVNKFLENMTETQKEIIKNKLKIS